MKNTIKWFGIIALMAIIVFSMVSCDEDTGIDNVPVPSDLIGRWVFHNSSLNQDWWWEFKSNSTLTEDGGYTVYIVGVTPIQNTGGNSTNFPSGYRVRHQASASSSVFIRDYFLNSAKTQLIESSVSSRVYTKQ